LELEKNKMKKRILLIGKKTAVEPLGLMYLHSALKDYGVNFYLLDGAEDILKIIDHFNPKYVGFSVFTGWHLVVKQFCYAIKKFFPEVKTIMGGPHASWFHDKIDYTDHIVVGDGCSVLPEILENGNKKIFRSNFASALSFTPRRDLLYQIYPEYQGSYIKSIVASLNCAFKCSYCFNSNPIPEVTGTKFREVDAVIDEAKSIFYNYPETKIIFFQDDVFGVNQKWLDEFADKWRKEINEPFAVQFRLEMVNDAYLTALREAGCRSVTFAFESSNPRIRKLLNRSQLTETQILERANLVKSYGIKIRTEQMLGLPTSTVEDDLKLLEWNVALKPELAWASIYVPYLGTVLGEYCAKEGLYKGQNDDVPESFFEKSCLNFAEKHKVQIEMLQKIYSTCARFDNGHEIAKRFLDGGDFSWKNWYKISKQCVYESFYA